MAMVVLSSVRLAKDPEVKNFGGKERLVFSVAETVFAKGEKSTRWWNIIHYDTKLADLIGKGCVVTVIGDLQAKVFKDKVDFTIFTKELSVGTFKEKGAEKVAAETPAEEENPF